MSLYVVATPIGADTDISLRAINILKASTLIIGEERKILFAFLKRHAIPQIEHRLLNEHSDEKELLSLVELCREQTVSLISDCGTPGFCDPGAALVRHCREKKIPVLPIPGPSSLMAAISVSGLPLNQFVFQGFLPAKTELRTKALAQVARETRTQVLMDTPYRLSRLCEELAAKLPGRKAFLALNISQEDEEYAYDLVKNLAKNYAGQKKEFVLILESSAAGTGESPSRKSHAPDHFKPLSSKPKKKYRS